MCDLRQLSALADMACLSYQVADRVEELQGVVVAVRLRHELDLVGYLLGCGLDMGKAGLTFPGVDGVVGRIAIGNQIALEIGADDETEESGDTDNNSPFAGGVMAAELGFD